MEPGTWKAKAVSSELGKTKNGGEQVSMTVEFLDGPNQGSTWTWYGYFTERTTDRTLESLMIAGWDGNDLIIMNGLGSTAFSVVCENEEYNGKEQFKIQWINRLGRNAPTMANKMEDAEKLAFAERIKGRALALKQKTVSQPQSVAETDQLDEIPF